jgi:ATP-dependent Lon protease
MVAMSLPSAENPKIMEDIPKELPILPLRNTVAFPRLLLPLAVGIPRSVKLIEDAMGGQRLAGLLTMKDPSVEEPMPGQIYEIGTVAKIHRIIRNPDDNLHVVVEGLERFRIDHWLDTQPYLRAQIILAPEEVETDVEMDALIRSLRDLAKEIVELIPNLQEQVGNFLNQVHDPR